jgi:phospholipase C
MKSVFALALTSLLATPAFADPAPGKLFQHMVVVVLENTNYDEAMQQPFMASLAQKGALLSNFQAESHPSQPNYIAMVSGSTQGVNGDGNVNLAARHLGDLLEEKGYDWKAYAEGYPGNCFLGAKSGKYARKHVPFLSFRNVQGDAARCAKVVNARQFDADVAAGSLPAFSFYAPDLDNDGHDTGAAYADRWLRTRFEHLLTTPSFAADTLFVLTFDENDDMFGESSSNQVFTALVGPMVRGGSNLSDSLNHYSLLRLAEDNWSLDHLTRGDGEANPIVGIWQ